MLPMLARSDHPASVQPSPATRVLAVAGMVALIALAAVTVGLIVAGAMAACVLFALLARAR